MDVPLKEAASLLRNFFLRSCVALNLLFRDILSQNHRIASSTFKESSYLI